MKPLSECRLYAFVDTAYLRGRAPDGVAKQLCAGGADLIQLRAKQSSLDEIRRMAQAILPVTRRAGVGLVINDHLSIAYEVGAEFCHLGQEDFFGAGHTHISQLKTPSTLNTFAMKWQHAGPSPALWDRRAMKRACCSSKNKWTKFAPSSVADKTNSNTNNDLNPCKTN